MWFAACLIISCYFNTTLTSFFTEPGRLRQLATVQDIIDSNIQIAMSDVYNIRSSLVRQLIFFSLFFSSSLLYRYLPILTADPVQNQHLISKNMNCSVVLGLKLSAMGTGATFIDKIRAEHIAAQWVSSSGEQPIHFIADGSLKYWHNIVFHRGNVFTERTNDLVQRIM